MRNARQVPVLRVLLPLCLGIILQPYVFLEMQLFSALCIVIASFTGLFVLDRILRKRVNLRLINFTSNYTFLLCVFIGIFLKVQSQTIPDSHFLNNAKSDQFQVVVKELKTSDFGISAIAEVCRTGNAAKRSTGLVLIYLPADASSLNLTSDDTLAIIGNIYRFEEPELDFLFNRKKYYHEKGILGYCYAGNAVVLGRAKNQSLMDGINAIRTTLNQQLELVLKDSAALNFAKALLLGNKASMDENQKATYAHTGIIHVLAVSGLHVGIIYLLFLKILPFRKKKGLRSITMLLVLWLYAAITGLAPPVVRSTIMFSFIILGKSLNRDTNIYNSISLAALVLLIYKPGYITNLSFQFSFIAVLGIVFFSDRIKLWYKPQTWLGDKVWSLMAVSLSAQLVTFPLSIYYFHQFPVYFLLTNLIAIPLVTLILYLGLFMLLISAISIKFGLMVAWLVTTYITFLDSTMKAVEELPFAYIEHISISSTILLLMIITVILFGVAIFLNNTRLLYTIIGSVALIICIDWFELSISKPEHGYLTKNEIHFFSDHQRAVVIGSANNLNNTSFKSYALKAFMDNKGVCAINLVPFEVLKQRANYDIIACLGRRKILFNNGITEVGTKSISIY